MAEIRIGISGWTYAPWRGTFFPRGLRQADELAYAARQVRTIEINGTFYSLQRPTSYRAWRDQTPDDFVFSVKGPRYITHLKRVRDVAAPLANFFASGVLELGGKLGPILWQLPPGFVYDPARLAAFFARLPRTRHEARKLARRHDPRVQHVSIPRVPDGPLRHALEIRHPSFASADFIALLREHDVALVVADTAGKWPKLWDVTSDFVYVRLHGDAQLYVSGYTPRALNAWAREIRRWQEGGGAPASRRLEAAAAHEARDVYVYFDNDVKVRAPFDAMNLAHRLGLGPKPGEAPPPTATRETPRTSWAAWTRRDKSRQAPSGRSSPSPIQRKKHHQKKGKS